jgi:hypothetical protein
MRAACWFWAIFTNSVLPYQTLFRCCAALAAATMLVGSIIFDFLIEMKRFQPVHGFHVKTAIIQ